MCNHQISTLANINELKVQSKCLYTLSNIGDIMKKRTQKWIGVLIVGLSTIATLISILWMYIVLIMYLKDDISISAIILPCGIFVGSIISLFVGMSVSSVS